MAKTPVALQASEVEVRGLPEFVYLWDEIKKKKSNQKARWNGCIADNAFSQFSCLKTFFKKNFKNTVINEANLLHDFLCIKYS